MCVSTRVCVNVSVFICVTECSICAILYVSVSICLGVCMLWHEWMKGDNLRCQSLSTTCLRQDFMATVYSRLAGLHTCGDSPDSTSHLPIGALVLQPCLAFTWVLAVRTHVLVLLW